MGSFLVAGSHVKYVTKRPNESKIDMSINNAEKNLHVLMFVPSSGKNRRLSLIFDSCWRNQVSNFCLGKYAKVGPFCEDNVAINTGNSLDYSGSNETMQKVLASIV